MSHPAVQILAELPLDGGAVEVTLVLACGCTVTRSIAASRIVETEDGRRIAAGKFPCPAGHPVRPPSTGG
jgi:Fe2+ transport system protein B